MESGSSNAGTGNVSPTPASFLLASEAHVALNRNRTTAIAKRSWGDDTVEVTFWIADPPNVSYYTLGCNKTLVGDADLDELPTVGVYDVDVPPRVVGAEGRFVLVRVGHCGEYEYFMYKGHPESPSLENVPLPDDGDYDLSGVDEFAIVPRGDDGHYLLIALCDDDDDENYHFLIYSSEGATWRTKELPNPCPGVDTITPDKVFVIRDGLLLWVDLRIGMLLCDILQEPYHAQYIPLPEPLLGNRERVKESQCRVRRFRDLTCVDGLIKFIEMEHREIVREITVTDGVPPLQPIDPRSSDVLYDSDLIKLMKHKPVEPEIRIERSEDGWSAMTWTREIGSNCWLKGRTVDVDDILVDDSVVFSELLSGQRSEPDSAPGNLTFKKMHSSWPNLSADGNDILYLKSYEYGRGAVVAVDLAEKTLKVEAPGAHPFGIYFYVSPWNVLRPCALANHLKKTPGIQVSASQIARTGSSANKQTAKAGLSPSEPNNTAIHVSDEPDNKRPRLQALG